MASAPERTSALRARRRALGWSLDALAARVGASRQQLIAYEHGRTVPNPARLAALATVLECAGTQLAGTAGGTLRLSGLRQAAGYTLRQAAAQAAPLLVEHRVRCSYWLLGEVEAGRCPVAWRPPATRAQVHAALATVYGCSPEQVHRVWEHTCPARRTAETGRTVSAAETRRKQPAEQQATPSTPKAPAATSSSASRSKAHSAWDGLNSRQQAYLSAIYEADQAAEHDITARRRQGERVPPAAEWRQPTFAITGADLTPIQRTLRHHGVHDPGAGASLHALQRRGLVTLTHDEIVLAGLGAVPRVRVRLSTTGRAAVRAGTGETAPRRTPSGLTTRGLYRALARLYAAGTTGLPMDPSDRALGGERTAPPWEVLLHLRDRRSTGSLIEEFSQPRTGGGVTSRVRLSEVGRAHYEQHHACYRELYPELDHPDPVDTPEHAHTGLADHRRR